MSYNKNNIFAKILRKEANAEVIYENEYVFCFKDIFPKAKIHILIIPKSEYTDIYDFSKNASSEEKESIFVAFNTLAPEPKKLIELVSFSILNFRRWLIRIVYGRNQERQLTSKKFLKQNSQQLIHSPIKIKTNTDLSKVKNKNVKLGIRSEFIDIADDQSNNTVKVKINRIEDFGNFKLLTSTLQNKMIKSKIDREKPISEGEVNLYIPPEKCCVYVDDKLI